MTRKANRAAKVQVAPAPIVVNLRSGSKRVEIAKKAGRASGDSRTSKAQERVRAAMRAIEAELVASGQLEQLFPRGLTMRDVAERAGINPGSFYTDNLRELGREVNLWVKRQNGVRDSDEDEATASGGDESQTSHRRSLAQRYADLLRKWKTVLQDTRDTKLALQQMKSELETALAENAQLQREYATLEARLSAFEKKDAKVVRLPRNRD